MFATYTIANPQHGGQKRVRAIYDAYTKSPKININFCAVYYPPHYQEHWSGDIAIPRQHSSLMASNPLTGDVITGRLVRDDKKIRAKIVRKIKDTNPDIIHIEQPFLYIGLKEILDEIKYAGKIIYGSQNIEYPMKEEMLEGMGFDLEPMKAIVKEIKDIEIEISKRADLIFCVSEGDIKSLAKLGIAESKILLARNGIEKQSVNSAEEKYWDDYFKEMGVDKIAVFVGSAHPPNWTGFQAMIGSKIGFLKRNERIVLAGSIGEYFKNSFSHGMTNEVLFWKRIIATGRLSEDRLTGLLGRADCLLLPLIEGGGSNLKTAEALLSQKPIVGTSHGFRAFEMFINYPTINVSDDPEKFRKLIAKVLREKQPKLSGKQVEKLDQVTWDSCLRSAVEGVIKL